MKRSVLILALLVLLVLVVVAIPVAADNHELPPHPHILLQRPEIDFAASSLVGVRKCVDLASNEAVPLHAHHEHIHFADAGVSFGGEAGHAVAPTAPFPGVPWGNCAEFLAFLPLPLPGE